MGFLKSFYDPLGFFGGDKKGEQSGASAREQSATYDPLQAEKNAVASPLSKFLAGQAGQGIGEFPTDPNYTNRYNDYLQVNPSEYFDKNIADPATKRYKEDFLPVIREGYAGNLRGSGRFGAEEAGINRFSEDLATTKAGFVPQFAKSQIDVGQSEFQRRYSNWYNSLAVNNPVLGKAIDFLNSGKSNTDSARTDNRLASSQSSPTGSDWAAEFAKIGLQILPFLF